MISNFCFGGIVGWTVICRFGEYGDYASGACFSNRCEDLGEAARRAVEKGLITQAEVDKACPMPETDRVKDWKNNAD